MTIVMTGENETMDDQKTDKKPGDIKAEEKLQKLFKELGFHDEETKKEPEK